MTMCLRILAFCLLWLPASAQTPREDLARMNKLYQTATSYEMSMTVKLYETGASTVPLASYSGLTKMQNQQYYVEMMGRCIIVNDSYALVIDKMQKLILVRDISKDRKTPAASYGQQINIDSLLKADKSTMSYVANTAAEKRILVLNPESNYEKVEIRIDPKTGMMTQLTLVNREEKGNESGAQKVVVQYTGLRLNQPVPASFFSEKAYIVKKGKTIAAAPLYKSFKVMDQGSNIVN